MHTGAEADGCPGKFPGRRVTILIAEDSESNQALYSLYLKDTCCTVVFADNGREAVEAFKQRGCDIVLMDLLMPVLDGLNATREIRAFERENGLSPTPIVAVSAGTLGDAPDTFTWAGCTEFLTKPIRRAALFDCIARLSDGGTHE